MFNAILKWSLSQQDPEPNRDIKPLSDEDKTFLDRAMKSMMINETERYATSITSSVSHSYVMCVSLLLCDCLIE
jgi:hypothetical protein